VKAATMDITPVDLQATTEIEQAEAHAWVDLYAAAPCDFARKAGLGAETIGGALVLHWASSGRRYFSRTIGLGVAEPVTEEIVDAILAFYRDREVESFLLQRLPQCQPAASYKAWLRQRGLELFDRQDRVIRAAEPLTEMSRSSHREITVERVDSESADEWSAFIQRVYRLDTGSWLPRLIGRRGWHQYVAYEAGEIVAARGMYIAPDGIAWLGMDGPVPGITTTDYEPDAALCQAIVADGLSNGAREFIADIEAPAAAMNTPAYDHFARLGFRRPYVRTHYARI
jgi:hypothetical protein